MLVHEAGRRSQAGWTLRGARELTDAAGSEEPLAYQPGLATAASLQLFFIPSPPPPCCSLSLGHLLTNPIFLNVQLARPPLWCVVPRRGRHEACPSTLWMALPLLTSPPHAPPTLSPFTKVMTGQQDDLVIIGSPLLFPLSSPDLSLFLSFKPELTPSLCLKQSVQRYCSWAFGPLMLLRSQRPVVSRMPHVGFPPPLAAFQDSLCALY